METRVLAHFSACAFPYIAVLGKVNLWSYIYDYVDAYVYALALASTYELVS